MAVGLAAVLRWRAGARGADWNHPQPGATAAGANREILRRCCQHHHWDLELLVGHWLCRPVHPGGRQLCGLPPATASTPLAALAAAGGDRCDAAGRQWHQRWHRIHRPRSHQRLGGKAGVGLLPNLDHLCRLLCGGPADPRVADLFHLQARHHLARLALAIANWRLHEQPGLLRSQSQRRARHRR